MVIVTYLLRGNALSPYRLLFPITSKGSFPTDRTAHITAFDETVLDRRLERKIAQIANAPAFTGVCSAGRAMYCPQKEKEGGGQSIRTAVHISKASLGTSPQSKPCMIVPEIFTPFRTPPALKIHNR